MKERETMCVCVCTRMCVHVYEGVSDVLPLYKRWHELKSADYDAYSWNQHRTFTSFYERFTFDSEKRLTGTILFTIVNVI